jgi:hypothetical protein
VLHIEVLSALTIVLSSKNTHDFSVFCWNEITLLIEKVGYPPESVHISILSFLSFRSRIFTSLLLQFLIFYLQHHIITHFMISRHCIFYCRTFTQIVLVLTVRSINQLIVERRSIPWDDEVSDDGSFGLPAWVY